MQGRGFGAREQVGEGSGAEVLYFLWFFPRFSSDKWIAIWRNGRWVPVAAARGAPNARDTNLAESCTGSADTAGAPESQGDGVRASVV